MSLAKTEEKREKIRNGDGKAKARSVKKKSVWLLEDDDLDTGEEPSNALQELAHVKKTKTNKLRATLSTPELVYQAITRYSCF